MVIWNCKIRRLAGALRIKSLEKMYGADTMPQTAENVAQRYQYHAEEQDQFAFESQQRAKKAMEENRFAE